MGWLLTFFVLGSPAPLVVFLAYRTLTARRVSRRALWATATLAFSLVYAVALPFLSVFFLFWAWLFVPDGVGKKHYQSFLDGVVAIGVPGLLVLALLSALFLGQATCAGLWGTIQARRIAADPT